MTTNSSAKSAAWTAFPVSAARQPAKDSSTNTRSSKTMLLMCFQSEQRRLFNSPGIKKEFFFSYILASTGTERWYRGVVFSFQGSIPMEKSHLFSLLFSGGSFFERPFFLQC